MENFYTNQNIQEDYQIYNRINPSSIKDYGKEPIVVNIENITKHNNTFRTTLWTGEHLQLTLMSIAPGSEIGIEMHENLDQFIRIEQGTGFVQMGTDRTNLTFERRVFEDYAIIIPAGTWHNLKNIGKTPIKLYSLYAPPAHKKGTVHITKEDDKE